MNSRWIVTDLLLTAILHCANTKLLGTEKGSLCNGGKCALLNECLTVGDFRKTKPEICSFQGVTPVICCPSAAPSVSTKKTTISSLLQSTSTATGLTTKPTTTIPKSNTSFVDHQKPAENQFKITYTKGVYGGMRYEEGTLTKRSSLCEGGECKLLNECSTVGNFRKTRPDICSFQDKTPIICCPLTALPLEIESTTTSTTNEATILQVANIIESTTPRSSEKLEVGIMARKKCLDYSQKVCLSSQSTFRAKREDKLEFHQVVLGGTNSNPKDLTFMALLGYGEWGSQEWDCGGTLISDYWVLSAAHCKTSRLGDAKWIRVGELDLESDKEDAHPQDFPIIETVIHPEYGPEPITYNDIALFKSNYRIYFNQYVRPICLETYLPNIYNKPWAAGWGTTAFGGERSSILKQVELEFVKTINCSAQYGRSKLLPSGIKHQSQICAGGTLGKDTCGGDSGGPLFQKQSSLCLKYQIGVTSFGRKCGILPGVYTWVLNYIDWIEEIVWSNDEEATGNKFDILI